MNAMLEVVRCKCGLAKEEHPSQLCRRFRAQSIDVISTADPAYEAVAAARGIRVEDMSELIDAVEDVPSRSSPDAVFDPNQLYEALNRRRRHRHLSWRNVAEEAGISPSTLTRLGYGHRPDATGLVRLLLWLGSTDLEPFISRPNDHRYS